MKGRHAGEGQKGAEAREGAKGRKYQAGYASTYWFPCAPWPPASLPPSHLHPNSPQDLPRTFPGHRWVEGEEGQEALRRVLVALSLHCKEVGYCQGLNFLAAMLLLCTDKV